MNDRERAAAPAGAKPDPLPGERATRVADQGAIQGAPEWTVVVPFFGSSETIERCVRSVLRLEGASSGAGGGPGEGQLSDLELLLVDNASTDESRQLIEPFEKDPRVQVLWEEEQGAYAARNAALRVARGRRIAFTDADCEVDDDWLGAAGRALDAEGAGAVIGRCDYPAEASLRLHLLGRYENAKARHVLGSLEPSFWFAYANNLAVRADLFERVGHFVHWPRAADSEWIHRMTRRTGERLVFAPEMRVVHLEFRRARRRLRRLRVYTGTNARIEGFRELSNMQRLRIAARAAFDR